jgi:hypothetical protein
MWSMITTDRHALPLCFVGEHSDSHLGHFARLERHHAGAQIVHLARRSAMTLTGQITELDPSMQRPIDGAALTRQLAM